MEDDVIVHDLVDTTVGHRLRDAKRVGFPLIVLVGKRSTEDPCLLEVIDVNGNVTQNVHKDDVTSYIMNFIKNLTKPKENVWMKF